MKNLLIATRLKLLIAILAAGMFAIGYNGLRGIKDTNESLQSVYQDRTVAIGKLASIQTALFANRLVLTRTLEHFPAQDVQRGAAVLAQRSAAANQLWRQVLASRMAPGEEERVRALGAALTRYNDEGMAPLLQALRAGDAPAAKRIQDEVVEPLFGVLEAGFQQLVDLQLAEAGKEYALGQARFTRARIVSWALFLSALALAVPLGWGLLRGITRSTSQGIAAMDAVAHGNLAYGISVRGKDEVAQMLQALVTMQGDLTQVVSSVRRGAQAVAGSSAEIAQGNNDLSARTEQQASALEQTAASMEQLRAAVQQNTQAAQQADQLAGAAADVASQGGQVVGDVVKTMREINASSQKISEIIGTIDGIAFQTNILALNAAVEAARAGEQGRGFAVVASEVRALAGRSADASKEIRQLIHASMERVGQGTALVDRAGQTMSQVVASIQRVTDLMGRIRTASEEQTDGVSQISEAVTQMDQVTQQNAALVEQMAASAMGLKAQAQELLQSVALFELNPQQQTV